MNEIEEKYNLKAIKDELKKKGIYPKKSDNPEKKTPEFISYSAVVLKDLSKERLRRLFKDKIPEGWEVIAHHMTINMGEISDDAAPYLGMAVMIYGVDYAINDKVLSLGVDPGNINVKKEVPHITIAVNRKAGAKPKDSNDIPKSEYIKFKKPIRLSGYVKQIPHKIEK